MKRVFLALTIALISMSAMAQQSKGDLGAGVKLLYGTEIKNIGIGARLQYMLTDNLRGEGSFDYFFEKDDLNMWKKKYMTATDVEGRMNAKKMQKKYEDELAFMDREENPFAEAYKFDYTKNLDVKPADDLAAAGEGVKESWQDHMHF